MAQQNNDDESAGGLSASGRERSSSRHPTVAALERFASDAPFVTKCLIYGQWITYLLSWLVPNPSSLDLALSNYPEFTLRRYEFYRIMTCVLVNLRLSDLVFVYLLVVPPSAILERALGSARFAYLTAALLVASNLVFVATWILVSTLFLGTSPPSPWWTYQSTSSLWIIGFGLMSMEAVISDGDGDGDDPDDDRNRDRTGPKYRKVCCWTVRTRHAPLVLYGLTGLLSLRYDVGCLVSLLLGYVLGQQRNRSDATNSRSSSVWSQIAELLDRVLVSAVPASRLQRCEESGCLSSVANDSRSSSAGIGGGGWVTVPMATGMRAFFNVGPHSTHSGGGSSSESMLPLFQMPARRAAGAAASGNGGNGGGGAGRVLGGGGATRGGGGGGGGGGSSSSSSSSLSPFTRPRAGPSPDEARAARLQALDRKSAAVAKNGGVPSDAA